MPEELGFLKYLKQAKVGGGVEEGAAPYRLTVLACSCSNCVKVSGTHTTDCQPEQQSQDSAVPHGPRNQHCWCQQAYSFAAVRCILQLEAAYTLPPATQQCSLLRCACCTGASQ